jgi:cobyrinic acid a,c-diamide synthase
VILSGGFPEVYAEPLAANRALHAALRTAHGRGLPIYAECGGLMYLTRTIVPADRSRHDMVGLLPGECVMSGRMTLGYRLARAAAPSWLFGAEETVRGHEFHFSTWQGRPDDLPPAYVLLSPSGTGPVWPEGARLGSLWASYVHVHFGAKPEMARRFVAACRRAEAGGQPCEPAC